MRWPGLLVGAMGKLARPEQSRKAATQSAQACTPQLALADFKGVAMWQHLTLWVSSDTTESSVCQVSVEGREGLRRHAYSLRISPLMRRTNSMSFFTRVWGHMVHGRGRGRWLVARA